MSEMYENDDTPTGMQPYNHSNYLVHQPAHPHLDEYNQPAEYGDSKPHTQASQTEVKQWADSRARLHHDTGSPLPPGGNTP